MLLGAHESTSGGLHQAFGRAVLDGAETVQIFTKSSRMWRSKEITPDDAKLFRAEAERTGFQRHTSVHASYLINLGSAPGDLREKSVAAFIDELQRCDVLGDPLHPAHVGDSRLLATPFADLQHAGLWIKRRHVIEQPGQGHLQDARSTAHIEQLAGAIKRQLPGHCVR